MKLFHISHTDLDGYGCQLISKKIFPDGTFYNANYGLEVKLLIKKVLGQIENLSKEDHILFLITDLNLTTEESKNLNNSINRLKDNGLNITLQLLDHHGTGSKSANRYEWYYLDTSRSATKITYDYFIENFEEFNSKCEDGFKNLVDAINAVDIWLSDDNLFEFGKVCMSMVSRAFEINNILFADQNREYRHYLLSSAVKYINSENGHIKLDEDIYSLKKEYLKQNGKNDTIDNLSSLFLVNTLETVKNNLTVYYKEYKGLLTYTLGGISIPANAFLKANPDYDFFIDIGRRGKAGLRADNKLDVSLLAQKLAGGGGHPNASGCAFEDFKETVIYDDVKKFIQDKLDKCN